jgi:Asp/Glu/hydantoin racemase
MRLLLINPNTSTALTNQLEIQARGAMSTGTALHCLTAPRGFPYISNRSEGLIAGGIVLEMLATQARDPDAAIIGAFGDPGARAARGLFGFPVVGVAEAALHSAAMLGDRFSIVAFTQRMRAWYLDCVYETGLERRLAGFRAPMIAPQQPETAQHDLRDALLDCIRVSREEDGADVVIVAGAPLAGFAAEASLLMDVPLVDPVVAAVRQAEALFGIAARNKILSRRDPKASAGLDPALAARFEGREAGPHLAAIDGAAPIARLKP